jgi:hypothetical protein
MIDSPEINTVKFVAALGAYSFERSDRTIPRIGYIAALVVLRSSWMARMDLNADSNVPRLLVT